MESKNKKTKGKIKIINENVIKNDNEVVFTDKVEKQNDHSDIPEKVEIKNKNIFKINYKNILKNKFIPWILLVIFLLSSFYLWFQLSSIKKDPLKVAQAEINAVVQTVGKIMVLPIGETPKMATLTDADLIKLKNQSFFANAKAGDKVLVYSIARKVILYDPKANKIVEVSNLDGASTNQPSPTSVKK